MKQHNLTLLTLFVPWALQDTSYVTYRAMEEKRKAGLQSYVCSLQSTRPLLPYYGTSAVLLCYVNANVQTRCSLNKQLHGVLAGHETQQRGSVVTVVKRNLNRDSEQSR